ncbi:hypothetical protein [Pseudomonas amygdali]|uniref:hypothetical protein n=1 Tax=Pseudomonas amygdali TaxID=47877 RepID=UPI0006B891CD|nr:hypothetical protein [Pseudomonas amygdali]KPB28451.1 Uncharacterized protein AC516_2970 [Pseudomonas amygdali pv. sesami]KPY52969.1 hypothetical protein ALO93_200179 [Pseudomonas amygdali pv. sesami]RMU01523.1 hypothetical protein ALP37_200016 [Pseudomonas amygdali pv. sesami]
MRNEFKMVPVEPTPEMLAASWSAPAGGCASSSLYAAMIAAAPQPPALGGEPDAFVREVFLRNGFTIKEGQTDLKPYVYAAAKELTAPLQAEIDRLSAESEWRGKMAESNCAEHDKTVAVAHDLRAERDQLKARCDELEKAFRKLRDVAHDCEQIASSYSPCIDSVEEHGGDDHEDPSCAIHHRLYYAMFDADAALSKPAGSEKV